MKQEYIKKVGKNLTVSGKQKREILRDLDEAFDSAQEHGETEEQVAARLGPPEEFAESMENTMGRGQARERKKRKRIAEICIFCVVAAVCLIAALIAKRSAVPDNVIGQADAMTTITVHGFFPFDLLNALLGIGLVFAIAAGILIIGLIRKKK